MPKCLLAFIAAADDYSCVPNSVLMLEVHLTSQEVETASLRVNAKKIVLSPGYLCTFDKTIKSHAGEAVIHYYKGVKEGVEIQWLPSKNFLVVSDKDVLRVYYKCKQR